MVTMTNKLTLVFDAALRAENSISSGETTQHLERKEMSCQKPFSIKLKSSPELLVPVTGPE
jgi:hypothetical protein